MRSGWKPPRSNSARRRMAKFRPQMYLGWISIALLPKSSLRRPEFRHSTPMPRDGGRIADRVLAQKGNECGDAASPARCSLSLLWCYRRSRYQRSGFRKNPVPRFDYKENVWPWPTIGCGLELEYNMTTSVCPREAARDALHQSECWTASGAMTTYTSWPLSFASTTRQ